MHLEKEITMKKIATTLLFLAVAAACLGQDRNIRRWSEGIKDWSGYQVVDPGHEGTSYTDFSLYKEKKSTIKNGITYRYIDVIAGFRPAESWVRSDKMTEQELSAVRRDFDLLEYFAWQFRDTLLTTQDKDGSMLIEYNRRFRKAREEVLAGADMAAYSLPAKPFDITEIPWTFSSKSGGISLAVCTTIPFGSLARLLSPGPGLSVGFERKWEKNSFLLEGTMGTHWFKQPYYDLKGAWNNKTTTPSLSLSLSYGRDIFSGKDMHLTVQGGPTFGGYLFTSGYSVTAFTGGPGLSEGICLDYIISRAMNFTGRYPDYADSMIRVRLYVNQFYNLRGGNILPTLNISVGFHIDNRLLTR